MKILILILCSIGPICFGQNDLVIPLQTRQNDIETGSYLKDTNKEFDRYLGTYEAIWENNKITLVIRKVEHDLRLYPDGTYYYEDYLSANYIIENLNNNVILEDNFNNSNVSFRSYYHPINFEQCFLYQYGNNCTYDAKICFFKKSTAGDISWVFSLEENIYFEDDCYHEISKNVHIPKVSLVLKQIK